MIATAAPRATGSAVWADALLRSFAKAGYALAEPPVLQPAEPFLDLSGEDIRKSLYLTTDGTGEELCLRPDLTIPVAREYLSSGRAGQPAGFSYLGPVFRYRGGTPSEFLQAGIESFGRIDRPAADAEMLALALQATRAFGLSEVDIRAGDVALGGEEPFRVVVRQATFDAVAHKLERMGDYQPEIVLEQADALEIDPRDQAALEAAEELPSPQLVTIPDGCDLDVISEVGEEASQITPTCAPPSATPRTVAGSVIISCTTSRLP